MKLKSRRGWKERGLEFERHTFTYWPKWPVNTSDFHLTFNIHWVIYYMWKMNCEIVHRKTHYSSFELRVPLSLKFDFRLPSSGSRPPPLDSPYFKTPSPGVGTFDSILTLKLQLNSYFWYGASSWLIFDHWRLNFDIIWPLVTLIGTQGTIWR